MVELFFSSQKCIQAVKSLSPDGELIVVTQKNDQRNDNPATKDLYHLGVIGRVRDIQTFDDRLKVLFEPKERVQIINFIQENPFFSVQVKNVEDDSFETEKVKALKSIVTENVQKIINTGRPLPLEIAVKIFSIEDSNRLVNNIAAIIDANIHHKQEILETVDLEERLFKVNKILLDSLKVSKLEKEVAEKTQEELSKTQKEVFLREEMKAIQKELGEGSSTEYDDLRAKIESAGMPERVKKIALKELGRLEKSPSFSPDVSFIRNYIDWLISMPWRLTVQKEIDLKQAKNVLNNDHFGLETVKERILQFLAVQKLVGKIKGPILCFVGPPGTGKTSIGQSIARSLNRKFVRMSLGGVRDESEIRGHRRTYVGAMPGRIIQGIQIAGETDPVFMLDEIDKIGSDFRGDPSAALLEALDPEQNINFSDHYLEVPYDLSNVFFITTANVLENIPLSLRDRMEVIEFPGYSPAEKLSIAKGYIWPKVVKSHGLTDLQITIDDTAVEDIINNYTLEAGVRNLERELSKLARKLALAISSNHGYPNLISRNNLMDFIGQPKVQPWVKEIDDQVGVVAALAVTEAGGQVLSVESSFMPGGHGNLTLTGSLGDIMKESAQAALSFARAISKEYKIEPNEFLKHDVHVHVPSGAIPKDGPSAGVAIASSIISAVLQRKIDSEVGVTGEVTLRGRILRVGGLKEKILAAKRAGLRKIVIPELNKGDLLEIAPDYLQGMNFILAKTMNDVIPVIFKK